MINYRNFPKVSLIIIPFFITLILRTLNNISNFQTVDLAVIRLTEEIITY